MKWIRSGAASVFLFFACLFSFFSIGHYGGDGYQDYLTARSLVMHGTMSVDESLADPDALDYKTDVGIKGRDGRLYASRSGYGMAFLIVPFYAAGHFIAGTLKGVPHDYAAMLAVSFLNPVVTALCAMLVFLLAMKLGFDRPVPFVLSLIYGLCTMAPVYARTGFPEPAGNLLLMLSVYCLISHARSNKTGHVVAGALCAGLMVLTKVSLSVFVPVLALYLFFSAPVQAFPARIGKAALYCLVFGAIFAGIMALNWYLYGSPLYFGGPESVNIGKKFVRAANLLKGAYYYLFSTGKGFFIFNVPLVLAFFVLRKAFKTSRLETALFMAIFAVNLLFFVKSFRRGSLFSWGPRYLMPSVPFLTLLLGYYIVEYRTAAARFALAVLSIAGALVMLPCMFINQSKFYNFAVEKLGVPEYIMNFVPDLSPVKGAWCLFMSRGGGMAGARFDFIYNPDYKLIQPITADMSAYNYFDMWPLKVLSVKPEFSAMVICVMSALAVIGILSFIRAAKSEN
jgi:hypothetical protein